mgnify:CR=1 FL=1
MKTPWQKYSGVACSCSYAPAVTYWMTSYVICVNIFAHLVVFVVVAISLKENNASFKFENQLRSSCTTFPVLCAGCMRFFASWFARLTPCALVGAKGRILHFLHDWSIRYPTCTLIGHDQTWFYVTRSISSKSNKSTEWFYRSKNEVEDVGQKLDFYWLEITSPVGVVMGVLSSAATTAICLLHTASYEKILDSQTKLF